MCKIEKTLSDQPYLIIDCCPVYNYKLKELSTGKELKRPVHANRLRSLRELDNDYRIKGSSSDVRLLECTTNNRKLNVSIRVGDNIYSRCDIIVNPANSRLEHNGGAAKSIARAAGDSLNDECRTYINEHHELGIATPLLTSSGLLGPTVKYVLHIVGPNAHEEPFLSEPLLAQQLCHDAFLACLRCADMTSDVQSIALPALCTGLFGMDVWTVSHAAVQALIDFDCSVSQVAGGLNTIEFVCLDMTTADIMNTVFRQVINVPILDATLTQQTDNDIVSLLQSTDSPIPDGQISDNNDSPDATEPAPAPAPTFQTSNGEWHAIKGIIRRQRRKGKELYLVE